MRPRAQPIEDREPEQDRPQDPYDRWAAEVPGFAALRQDLEGLPAWDANSYALAAMEIGPQRLLAIVRRLGWEPGRVQVLCEGHRAMWDRVSAAKREQAATAPRTSSGAPEWFRRRLEESRAKRGQVA